MAELIGKLNIKVDFEPIMPAVLENLDEIIDTVEQLSMITDDAYMNNRLHRIGVAVSEVLELIKNNLKVEAK